MKQLLEHLVAIFGMVSLVFGAFLFLEARHQSKEDAYRRLLMSESTRYAQIAKHYADVQRERKLTQAELERLDLVEREQDRIHKILTGGQ